MGLPHRLNHLLTECRGRAERWRMTFDVCRQAIEESGPAGLHDPSAGAEQSLICEEMKGPASIISSCASTGISAWPSSSVKSLVSTARRGPISWG